MVLVDLFIIYNGLLVRFDGLKYVNVRDVFKNEVILGVWI